MSVLRSCLDWGETSELHRPKKKQQNRLGFTKKVRAYAKITSVCNKSVTEANTRWEGVGGPGSARTPEDFPSIQSTNHDEDTDDISNITQLPEDARTWIPLLHTYTDIEFKFGLSTISIELSTDRIGACFSPPNGHVLECNINAER